MPINKFILKQKNFEKKFCKINFEKNVKKNFAKFKKKMLKNLINLKKYYLFLSFAFFANFNIYRNAL